MEDLENKLRNSLDIIKTDWQESIAYEHRKKANYVTEFRYELQRIRCPYMCFRIVQYLRHGMPGKGDTLFVPMSESSIGVQLRKEGTNITATELQEASRIGSIIRQQEMKLILAYGLYDDEERY